MAETHTLFFDENLAPSYNTLGKPHPIELWLEAVGGEQFINNLAELSLADRYCPPHERERPDVVCEHIEGPGGCGWVGVEPIAKDGGAAASDSKAIDFLNAFFGQEAWPLVAISRKEGEKPELTCVTFVSAESREKDVATWIALKNIDQDIYFDINPLKQPIDRKANKTDIAEARYLWADIDPPKTIKDDEALKAWRKSINHDVYPIGVPGLPTLIIDSGRGFWYFWKLKVAHPTDSFAAGKDENGKDIIEDGPLTLRIESFGRGLEKAYGADNCRNIDRIARLPGTVNHKTGRLASVKSFNSTRVYSYEDFPFESDEAAASGDSPDVAQEGAEVRQWPGLEGLSPRLRNTITAPKYEEFEGDRSNAVFYVACELVREGIGNDDGADKVLMNADYQIHDHIRDQAKSERVRRKYALSQMVRARKSVGKEKQQRKAQGAHADGISLDDFVAYMPSHSYIFIPTREMWPGASVDERTYNRGSKWLDKNKPVDQMTWAPGQPMLIKDRLIDSGGWIEKKGVCCFNLYRPPVIELGDPNDVGPFLDHATKIYPDTKDHIIKYLALKVQHPEIKINHGLVLGGAPGIGKDTLLEPVKYAVGHWNFSEVSPINLMGRFNPWTKAVIMRVSEAHDLGEVDRFTLYEHLKIYMANPPDVLSVDEKNLREHYIPNICGIIITTNYRTEALYLPPNDRRHHVSWSDLVEADFEDGYWTKLWSWYLNGGFQNVAAYLKSLNLSGFDPKAPPVKTEAFWAIVNANCSSEDAELADVLDTLGNPEAITLGEIVQSVNGREFGNWLADRRNNRAIPHRLETCGYVAVRNEDNKTDGRWKIGAKRHMIYTKKELVLRDRLAAAKQLIDRLAPPATVAPARIPF